MIATILFFFCSSLPVVVFLHVTGVQSANLLIPPRKEAAQRGGIIRWSPVRHRPHAPV